MQKQKGVWILNHYAQEPGGPGGKRHFSFASRLKALGWDATIIAASTELNTGRQRLAIGEKSRIDFFRESRCAGSLHLSMRVTASGAW